jgi:hypothetical protein
VEEKKRPIGVTILAILAGIAAVVAIIHTLQMLHLLPFSLGPFRFFTFDLLGAILWGILAAIWIWVITMLWRVDPQAWYFLVILSVLNLCLDFVSLIGGTSLSNLAVSMIVNAAVLIYCVIPSTKEAFDIT